MLNITELLTSLAESRKVFHSEADFQHALAWHIHQSTPKPQVRLEFSILVKDRKMYVDIWLPKEKVAIELKYATRNLKLPDNEEPFALRNHGAHNHRRYDFLKDIHRLELMCSKSEFCKAGHAVLLTNDQLYWDLPKRTDTTDSAFRVHEGQEIKGELDWATHTSPGTKRGRKESIQLRDSYCLHWQDYSCFHGEQHGKFRYLAVSVKC